MVALRPIDRFDSLPSGLHAFWKLGGKSGIDRKGEHKLLHRFRDIKALDDQAVSAKVIIDLLDKVNLANIPPILRMKEANFVRISLIA
mgnify:CR=1 FL=1